MGSLSQLLSTHAPSLGLTGHTGQASSTISTAVQAAPCSNSSLGPMEATPTALRKQAPGGLFSQHLGVYSTRHKMSSIHAKSVSIIQRPSANPGPICGHCWSRTPCPTALPNSCVWLPGASSLRTTRPSFLLLLRAELPTVCTGASGGTPLCKRPPLALQQLA